MNSDTQYIGPDAIIAKKQQYMIPCVYHFYRNPPQIVKGQGLYLYDTEGKKYLDLYSGVSVNALGHCHPEVTETICNQVCQLQHTTTIYLTEPIVNLAEALADFLPGDIKRSFFCASGSEANEGAALLATLHTGRNEFLALQNGLHGRTKLGMSLTGLSFWRTDPSPVGGITHIPAPHCKKCPFGQTFNQCHYQCVNAVETAINTSTSGKPAAMFVEPIQGNGGILTPPSQYFSKLKTLLEKYQILLIADEVQTGLGRTGKKYGIENWSVVPDIITGGKALGGATPIGYFSTTDEIAASYTRPGAATFGGNPVTAMAGLKVLEIIQRDNLVDNAAQLGHILYNALSNLAEKYDFITDLRGKGLMVGLEITDWNTMTAAELTDNILEKLKDKGIMVGKTGSGRNVITFMPPLIITEKDLLQAIDTLSDVFNEL